MRMRILPLAAVGLLPTRKEERPNLIASINGRRGFTLVEIIVSMLLLSTVAAGMLVVFVVGKRSVSLVGHKVQAISFAQETIDELRGRVGGYLWATPDTTLDVGDHDSDSDPDICALPAGDFLDTFNGARIYTVVNEPTGSADGEENYKKVTVTVNWNEP